MTLKEELEILRGEPIEVFTGDPMDIPCIETSDPEKLCKLPVVSVSMITYNHEPYIRQAIEGVMMQKTDFEFELIIGEDCSQDKTREICFEYQKKYPDKIRVLWWHENVSKLGGNGRRCAARRRGEFVALCEGDDYWTDPLKLQKQVDIMRKYPNVGMCFCNAGICYGQTDKMDRWDGCDAYPSGVMDGKLFHLYYLLGKNPNVGCMAEGFINTATVMFRRSCVEKCRRLFSVFSWRLMLGDKQLWLGLAAISDVYYLPDIVSVYRKTSTGAMAQRGMLVYRDSALIKIYFCREFLNLRNSDIPSAVYRQLLFWIQQIQHHRRVREEIVYWMRLLRSSIARSALVRLEFSIFYLGAILGAVCRVVQIGVWRIAGRFLRRKVSNRVHELYLCAESKI